MLKQNGIYQNLPFSQEHVPSKEWNKHLAPYPRIPTLWSYCLFLKRALSRPLSSVRVSPLEESFLPRAQPQLWPSFTTFTLTKPSCLGPDCCSLSDVSNVYRTFISTHYPTSHLNSVSGMEGFTCHLLLSQKLAGHSKEASASSPSLPSSYLLSTGSSHPSHYDHRTMTIALVWASSTHRPTAKFSLATLQLHLLHCHKKDFSCGITLILFPYFKASKLPTYPPPPNPHTQPMR